MHNKKDLAFLTRLVDLREKEQGSNLKINSVLNSSVEKLKLEEMMGSLLNF